MILQQIKERERKHIKVGVETAKKLGKTVEEVHEIFERVYRRALKRSLEEGAIISLVDKKNSHKPLTSVAGFLDKNDFYHGISFHPHLCKFPLNYLLFFSYITKIKGDFKDIESDVYGGKYPNMFTEPLLDFFNATETFTAEYVRPNYLYRTLYRTQPPIVNGNTLITDNVKYNEQVKKNYDEKLRTVNGTTAKTRGVDPGERDKRTRILNVGLAWSSAIGHTNARKGVYRGKNGGESFLRYADRFYRNLDDIRERLGRPRIYTSKEGDRSSVQYMQDYSVYSGVLCSSRGEDSVQHEER